MRRSKKSQDRPGYFNTQLGPDDIPDGARAIELLHMCRINTATSFEAGKKLLESEGYDIAILYIMGVNGFELLQSANTHKIPALMLTANALNEKSR